MLHSSPSRSPSRARLPFAFLLLASLSGGCSDGSFAVGDPPVETPDAADDGADVSVVPDTGPEPMPDGQAPEVNPPDSAPDSAAVEAAVDSAPLDTRVDLDVGAPETTLVMDSAVMDTTPPMETCVDLTATVTDGYFVAPDGTDGADRGTTAKPFATINAAIKQAASSSTRNTVYVSAGSYTLSSISFTGAAAGVTSPTDRTVLVWGGWIRPASASDPWTRPSCTTTESALIGSTKIQTTRSTAVDAVGLSSTLRFGLRTLTISAADASAALGTLSSYGLVVGDGTHFFTEYVSLSAGSGRAGDNGVGAPIVAVSPMMPPTCFSCGSSLGSMRGAAGPNGSPASSSPKFFSGAFAPANGADGAAGAPGGASTVACAPSCYDDGCKTTITATGAKCTVSVNGGSNHVGLEGTDCGAGGVGGNGAAGGKGGGASVGVLVYGGTTVFDAKVTTVRGSHGGAGGSGAPGLDGGGGALASGPEPGVNCNKTCVVNSTGDGCDNPTFTFYAGRPIGGAGGGGGGGGGGAGGPSFGLVSIGSPAVTIDGPSSFKAGSGGPGGVGGVGGKSGDGKVLGVAGATAPTGPSIDKGVY